MLNQDDYRFEFDKTELDIVIEQEHWALAFERLAEPLNKLLYEKQSFDLLDELSPKERLILCFDYLQSQVGQGGFIQFIQNGYVSLLVPIIESMQQLELVPEMAKILDDALKVYVLNIEILGKETSVQEFGVLYQEFQEFNTLEEQYEKLLPNTLKEIVLSVYN